MQDRRRILIIDDERALADAFCLRLLAAGYQPSAAYDAREALTLALSTAPDLIILDRRLPDMDGIEVLASLRTQPATAGIPVVLVSGSEADRGEAAAAGAAAFLAKPCRSHQLLKTIEDLLTTNPI